MYEWMVHVRLSFSDWFLARESRALSRRAATWRGVHQDFPVISQHAQHHRRSTYAVKHWQAHKRATYPGTYVSHHLREACRMSSDAWWDPQCCRPCLHCPTQ